ncbi:MAG: V-type ATP synthase subunit D [Planctomycetota bacterium]
MKKKVNPNRMNLLRLRKRLVLAQRGHKLLKDKLEGLIRELTDLIPTYRRARDEVDRTFPGLLARFTLATAVSPRGAVREAIAQNATSAELTIDRRRVMGVTTPVFQPPEPPESYRYSLTQTPPELDMAFDELQQLPDLLFRLAQLERSLALLAAELGRTRRRANALEYVLIPELQQQRREVEMKINERERGNITRLMKVKEMLMEERT